MSITLEITGYGDAAHGALANAVAQHKRGDPLRPVSVIVPSNFVGLAARRSLGRRLGVAAVSVLTVHRLSELLGSATVANAGKRPVSSPVLAGAVRAVLSRDPGRFEGVHTHPATERSLVNAHRALLEVPAEALEQLATTSSRTADVVRVHRSVTREIASDYSNEQDLLNAAIEAVKSKAPNLEALGPTILFLPDRMNAQQIRLLAALAQSHELHVIAASTGVAEADTATRLVIEQLGLKWSPPESINAPVADRALSVSDADDEVRHALRSIVEATLNGTPLNRCAVLYGSHEPYARMLADAFNAAGLEWFGQSVRASESSLMGRSLLGMLALSDHDFSRQDVFAWLAEAPVRRADKRLVPAVAWERASRAAGVVSGLGQWKSRLSRLVKDLEADRERSKHNEEHEWRSERLRQEAAHASDLADFVDGLAEDLRPRGELSWSKLALWCSELTNRYFGDEAARADWPAHEQKAAETIDRAVSRIGDLDGIDPNPSPEAFRRALELELGNDLGLHGAFGRGVLIGGVKMAVGLELDRVIVLGMAEGTMPARQRDDALIPDHVREMAGPGLPTRAEMTQDTQRALLAATASASQTLFMFPRGDLRQNAQRSPSRWLLDSCEAHDGVRPTAEELARNTGDWLTEVPSFIAGLRSTAFPAHSQEYDMRALLDWVDDGKDVRAAPAVKARQELQLGVDLIIGRRSKRFTRFDGNLTNRLIQSALDSLKARSAVTSASRLEQWAKCPHAYFVRHVLGVHPVEDPEEQYRISPMTFGTLVHLVLERWIEEARAGNYLPLRLLPWSGRAKRRLHEIGIEEAERLEQSGSAGRSVYWQREKQLFLRDLQTFVAFETEQRRVHMTRSVASELRFGPPAGEHGEVAITLADGRSIRLRGAIDRVDEGPRGGLYVVDYKTGSSKSYSGLLEDPFNGGTNLQLLIYGLAAKSLLSRPDKSVVAEYWFVTHKGDSTLKGEFQKAGYEITDKIKASGLDLVTGIVAGIESGLFPARPAKPQYRPWIDCHYCEPDGLGVAHQYYDWLRKTRDPRLKDYFKLIGEDVGEEDGGEADVGDGASEHTTGADRE